MPKPGDYVVDETSLGSDAFVVSRYPEGSSGGTGSTVGEAERLACDKAKAEKTKAWRKIGNSYERIHCDDLGAGR